MHISSIIWCVLFSSLLLSCNTKQTPAESITGNWLIVYPQHFLNGSHQRELYAKYQDSIVRLYGLKLISFSDDGHFNEADSLLQGGGKWMLTKDQKIKVQEGGRGFNPLNASFEGVHNEELQLVQYAALDDEKIKLVWHLKKITGEDEARLFAPDFNEWRRRPASAESDEIIKKRLVAMLNYYSVYFKLIATEAVYFSPVRVLLPLSYYQHAIGMNPEIKPTFRQLFHDDAAVQKAYAFLEQTINRNRKNYPSEKNFGLEYSGFLKLMADDLDKQNKE